MDVGEQPKQCQELHQCPVIYYIMQAAERLQVDSHYLDMEV